MREIKINKKGQITIRKPIREKYGWTSDITFKILDDGGKITVEPAVICYHCKKALPDKFRGINACPDCPLPEVIELY